MPRTPHTTGPPQPSGSWERVPARQPRRERLLRKCPVCSFLPAPLVGLVFRRGENGCVPLCNRLEDACSADTLFHRSWRGTLPPFFQEHSIVRTMEQQHALFPQLLEPCPALPFINTYLWLVCPPPPRLNNFPPGKNETYSRGRKLEAGFTYTNLFLSLGPPLPPGR